MSRMKFHPLTVSDVRRETGQCVSVAFAVPQELDEVYAFLPGQYLTIRATIDGQDLRRSYSICSQAGKGELRIAVKEVEGGVFSGWVNHNVKKGDVLEVMPPAGQFTAQPEPGQRRHYLLVAAGSGITPVISIAKSVLAIEKESEVTLLYGNRWFNSIIFRDDLEDLKDRYLGRFRLFHILSAEPNEIDLFHGRIDREKLKGFAASFVDMSAVSDVYVCGPEPIIHSVRSFSLDNGLEPAQVHFELFSTPGQTKKETTAPAASQKKPAGQVCDVTIILDGTESRFQLPAGDTPLLDAAQQHGLDIPYSCKGGMCCTCKAHLDDGTVRMEVNYALEPGEIEAGFILTCQARPTSPRVVVNFDRQH